MSELNSTQHAFDNAVNLLKDNNLNESIEQLHEILKVFPKHKDSIDLISDLFIKINEPKKALIYINKYLSIIKNSQKHLENKYKIYLYLGEDKNALKVLKLLHENHPTIRTARTISNYYLSNNDEEKSDLVIQSFFENNKSYSDLYKGIRHAKAGRNKLAEESYKNVLSKDNKNVDALRLLGLLAFKNNNHDIAEKLLIRAIQLDPYFHLLWDNLAKVFRVQNKLEESKKAFENLIKLDPKNNEAFVALGTIYNKLAQYKDGINSYKKALKLNDNNARVYLSMGHALKTLGNRNECEDSYLKAIKLFPLSGEGYWSLANLKTYTFNENQIHAMKSAIKEDMHEQEKIQMMFALGKAYESKKDFKESFKFYNDGNWMQRKTVEYNAEENSKSIDLTIDFFKQNKEKLNFDSGISSKDPIFILGLPRAGSTLLEQILSSHSMIEGTEELHNIMTIGRRIRTTNDSKNYLNNLLDLNKENISSYGNMYIDETRWARKDNNFFIDKMPNNFPHIGLIKMILPNAKIIDARRNPLDGCFSCFKQYFAKGQHFTYDLDDVARYYKDYLKIMKFWNNYFPDDIHTVCYENVINNPEQEVRLMLKYLGLDFEKSCMDFHKSSRPVKTASSEQVRQPIYKSGMNYWENYEDDLSTLVKHFPDYDK
ncbi:MAG: sulfotransferase family protein [SAR86 cluster bacterium]|uniref:Sulfotransferase family protein n=1 Tax=SAR86 cluster bacterium TaxID=2030880 RepID=A0A520MDZ0_9GAMM|nr:MAG: sulfotransferase family protein [SAR86 cluster bacterium]